MSFLRKGVLKKSNGAKLGVKVSLLVAHSSAVGVLDMNWSLPQQSCGAPQKAANEGFFDKPGSRNPRNIMWTPPPMADGGDRKKVVAGRNPRPRETGLGFDNRS